MLRCTLIALILAGCAAGPAPVPEPVEAESMPAQVTEPGEPDQTVAATAQAAEPDAPSQQDGITNKVTFESETFVYSMTLRLPDGQPDIRCSYGKRTGSHVQDKYCRTTFDAAREREAAVEFFDDARRSGN